MALQTTKVARNRVLLGLLCICFLLVALAFLLWRWRTSDKKQADAEAFRGLGILSQLVNSDNYTRYGFSSSGEVRDMSLGAGIAVSSVSADDLIEFNKSRTKLPDVIKSQDVRIYPVIVQGTGRLLIKVRKFDGKWRLASFGEKEVAKNLVQLETQQPTILDSPERQKALEVPAMNLYFLEGQQVSENAPRTLTPLTDVAVLQAMPALQRGGFLKEHPQLNSQGSEGVDTQDILEALAVEVKLMASPPGDVTHTSEGALAPEGPPDTTPSHRTTSASPAKGHFRCYPETSATRSLPRNELGVNSPSPRMHEVKQGECLALIAQHYYGKQAWRGIYERNLDSIKCGPDLVFPGQRFVIP